MKYWNLSRARLCQIVIQEKVEGEERKNLKLERVAQKSHI